MVTDKELIDRPLLSICIPTYNRAEYLSGTLENITSDPAFGKNVEIIISDNASTDNTKDVAEEYCQRYQNVHYFQNINNVRDENFLLCLNRANGVYRKLINDTCRFKEGKLMAILSFLSKNGTDTPVFFYPILPFLKKGVYNCSNESNFISRVGYFIGWLLTFGVYEQDMDCLAVDKKYYNLLFPQVAWCLEIVKKHSNAIVVVDDFYNSINPKGKGGYNLFKVQINNLFTILSEYGIHGPRYEIEKYRQFKYHISYLIDQFLIRKQDTRFDLSNSWETLVKIYGIRPYFYITISYRFVRYQGGKLCRYLNKLRTNCHVSEPR